MTEEPEGWHKKFEPYNGDDHAEFNDGDWKITEEDIERAINRWDESMKDYKGMLDADIERHKKIPPRHKGEYVYTPGKTELTEEDIDEAISEWDKTMPEHKGLLDADIEKVDKEFEFTTQSPTTKTCPYCGGKLEKIPTRKTKCPECGNYIFVRQGKLYTEEEKDIRDYLMRYPEEY